MGWSKQDLVRRAFEKIGLATYVFDLVPEQLSGALQELDSMVAGWELLGIRLGYSLPSSLGDDQLSDDSGLPDWANAAVYLNLAVLIAPNVGRPITPELAMAAKRAYNSLLSRAVHPIEMQLPKNMPAGQGHKVWRQPSRPFLDREDHPIDAESDAQLEINADSGTGGGPIIP